MGKGKTGKGEKSAVRSASEKKGKGRKAFLYAAVLIAAAAAALFLYFSGSGNTVMVEGVTVSSAEKNPLEAFPEISGENSFIVSPQFYEPAVNLNQYMFKGNALFLQVLEGNEKEVEQLVRVYSPEDRLLYCQTNYGSIKKSERLEAGECRALLGGTEKAVVLIQFPDNRQPVPSIRLSQKQIEIKPKSYADIDSTSFLALKIMYENSRSIIEASNQLVGQAGI